MPRNLRQPETAAAAGLLAVAGWIYWPALHGGWIWDDYMYIPQNQALRSLAGLSSIWLAPSGVNYFPVTSTVQWVQWHLWGDATFGYHLTNLALHLLNCLLVGRLIGSLAVGGRDTESDHGALAPMGLAGWVAALLFAVHPLAVESVAWISELKNVLSLAFLLGATLSYIHYEEGSSAQAGGRCRLYYAFSWLLFVLAMLSKSTVALFPAVILLFGWWKRGRVRRADLLAALPFGIAALGLGLVTVWFEHHRATAILDATPESLAARTGVAALDVAFYLSKSVIPWGLMPNYPLWSAVRMPALQFVPLAALGALTAGLRMKHPAWGRAAIFGWGCFLLNLAPVLGWIPMAYQRISPVADHFAYLSLVAVVGLAAAGWSAGANRTAIDAAAPTWFRRRPILAGLLLLTASALALESRLYAQVYRGGEAFWSYAAERNPDSWAAQSNLGLILAQTGRVTAALARYENALRLKPDDAGAHSNIGNLLGAEPGREADAIAHFESALRLNPDLAGAHNNLGLLLASQPGREADAIAHFESALRLQPNSYFVHYNLAQVLAKSRATRENAARHYAAALEINPDFAPAREALEEMRRTDH